jgi:hypothetical protein
VRTEEAAVLVIVMAVAIIWEILIVYQIRRGATFAFSSQKWEPPLRRERATDPRGFWAGIGLQMIFPTAAILYLLWFALSSS